MSDSCWDVVVIGAGAAGILAAIRAAERGRRTLLLEKNRKAGVKILMSGGTRCNITHATDNRGIVEAFGPPGRFLHSALAALSVQETIDLIEAGGVPTKVEETGKVFPVSNKAADVLAALLHRLRRSGATLALEEPVRDLRPIGSSTTSDFDFRISNLPNGRFALTTPHRTLTSSSVILTSGGRSYPGSGTTGDGYVYAAHFGHTIITPRAALVPVTVAAPWVADLRGITIPDVSVRILEIDECLVRRRGSLLFAHFGLSGPVILDVSGVVSRHARPESLALEIDFMPQMPEPALDEFLRSEAMGSGKKQLAGILAAHLPHRLCEMLLTLTGMPPDRKSAGLSKMDRGKLVHAAKQLRLSVTGTLGFQKAEVTAGGVALDEIDSRTMQSKRAPGLFIAGEILDLDGPIGGYNFQAAFSTGWLAGSSA
jgi:predicted Rossmann fold flavoprotein